MFRSVKCELRFFLSWRSFFRKGESFLRHLDGLFHAARFTSFPSLIIFQREVKFTRFRYCVIREPMRDAGVQGGRVPISRVALQPAHVRAVHYAFHIRILRFRILRRQRSTPFDSCCRPAACLHRAPKILVKGSIKS